MPDSRFVHLHLHSHYSLLDAAIKIPRLMEQVGEMGMPAVALTDHGNLFGAFQFHRAATKAGIRPILGCEVYMAPGDHRERKQIKGKRKPYYHFLLLAENQAGWNNLSALVSRAYLEGFYFKPRISKQLLSEHSEGLIATSACLSGEVPQYLLDRKLDDACRSAEEFREILGPDNFFLEIQNHGSVDEDFVREGMVKVSERTGIPLVATNDCHFHTRDDTFAHKVLIGIGQNKTVDELQKNFVYTPNHDVKSVEDMCRLFVDHPGACDRTVEIAERCEVSFDTDTYHLPNFPVPEEHTPDTFLIEVSRQGLESRIESRGAKASAEDYGKRLKYELEVIAKMGFPGYFLVVWDFMREARDRGVPVGPGRGSAAGSLVSYCLGITDIDPLEHDLLFERFLNPDRISMPDIDIDFCQRRREEVIEYVRELYGAASVSQIATFNMLKARSAVRDAGRVLGLGFSDTDKIAKLIPEDLGITIPQALEQSPELAELAKKDAEVGQVIDVAKRLEGLARHCGVHAAGVVIAPRPLIELVPLIKTPKQEMTTQFDKDDVEALGLLKMDFLGLKTLTVIADTLASIEQSGATPPNLDRIPFDDPEVYELFSAGDTDGVFQFESGGMKKALRKVQPKVFADIAALNALYRPGPMQFIDDFAGRKHGRKQMSYIVPELEPILSETYGIIVYQEQVMRIAVEIGGFSLAKADTLRKAMGKKIKAIIDREGENFVGGAIAKGFPRDKVIALWEQIIPFAEYGFNKSHSVAYAHVAYVTAFLKAHFAEHFMAAMLTSEATSTDKMSMYLGRCREMGIGLLSPSINHSERNFTVESESIRFGLSAVKGVGEAAVEAILESRAENGEFASLASFLMSLPARAVNTKVLDCLAKAGCFDAFGIPRDTLLENLEGLAETASRDREQAEIGQQALFAELGAEALEAGLRAEPRELEDELLDLEYEVLGAYLSGHPMDRFTAEVERFTDCAIDGLRAARDEGRKSVKVAGLVQSLEVRTIRKEGRNQGRKLGTFELCDQRNRVRVVAFPDIFERIQGKLEKGRAVILEGELFGADEQIELRAQSLSPLATADLRHADELRIHLDLGLVDGSKLRELRELLLEHSGPLPVRFELIRPGAFRARFDPPSAMAVEPSVDLIEKLDHLIGTGQAHLIVRDSR